MPSPLSRDGIFVKIAGYIEEYLVQAAALELGPGREHAHPRLREGPLNLVRNALQVARRTLKQLAAPVAPHLVRDAAEVEVVGLLALGARGKQRLACRDCAGDEPVKAVDALCEAAQELRRFGVGPEASWPRSGRGRNSSRRSRLCA